MSDNLSMGGAKWEDPEIDPNAAILQLQQEVDILETALRGKDVQDKVMYYLNRFDIAYVGYTWYLGDHQFFGYNGIGIQDVKGKIIADIIARIK